MSVRTRFVGHNKSIHIAYQFNNEVSIEPITKQLVLDSSKFDTFADAKSKTSISLLMTTQEAFVDSVDQDQTTHQVQSDR